MLYVKGTVKEIPVETTIIKRKISSTLDPFLLLENYSSVTKFNPEFCISKRFSNSWNGTTNHAEGDEKFKSGPETKQVISHL